MRTRVYGVLRAAAGWVADVRSVLVHAPLHRAFGHSAEDLFFGLIRARRENKRVLFLYPRPLGAPRFGFTVSNRELFDLVSPYSLSGDGLWALLGGYALTLLYGCEHISDVVRRWCGTTTRGSSGTLALGRSDLWQPNGLREFSWAAAEREQWRAQLDAYVPPRLRADRLAAAERSARTLGIGPHDWFACVHVPERVDGKARGASISTYVPAIKAITDAGGWVVRLGDRTMPPLPRMDRVIDSPYTASKSPLMDVYWMSHCRFFVGTNSGPNVSTELFRKPGILVNLSEWLLGFGLWDGDLAIPKHVFCRRRGRFLSVLEMLDEPIHMQALGSPADDYMLVENTPEEIRDVVLEFLTPSRECSVLQATFSERRRTAIRTQLESGERHRHWRQLTDDQIVLEKYRIAARALAARGTLGRSFLERNWIRDRELVATQIVQTSGSGWC